jgi:hypothetical protein
MGIPEDIFQRIEVFLHMTGLTSVLMAAYVCLQISYTRQRGKFRRLLSDSKAQSRVHHDAAKSTAGHRKFLMVNLLLIACLLISTLPVTVIWYFRLFSGKESEMLIIRYVALVVDNFLFLKFLVDPFIYAWRMPKYRRSLRHTIHACPSSLFSNCRSDSPRKRANTNSSVRTLTQMLGHKKSISRRSKSLRDTVEYDEDVV